MEMTHDSSMVYKDDTEQIPLHTVLIATDNPTEAEGVAHRLENIGFRIHIATYDGATLHGTPKATPSAILCYFTDFIERLPPICNALRKYFSARTPPIIAAMSRHGGIDRAIFDSVIFPPAHHSQIANRVNSLVRLQEMEREITLRVETLSSDFNIHHELTEASLRQPYRILFIGKASPDFMVIINALQKLKVEVVAAFTSYSAFDFLHEFSFDAVVMNALENSEPAMTIGETMRRNAKLFHVPTLFLVNENTFTEHEMAFKKGARDIISTQATEQEISGRILELANYHRIHSQLKREFTNLGGDTCLDAASGTFNDAFFSAHMRRVCQYHQKVSLSISLMAIKLTPKSDFKISDEKINHAYGQIGGILKNLVRMQDIVARLDRDIFAIALPGIPLSMTRPVFERISGIIDCAAFDSGHAENSRFTVSIETSVVELQPHEDSDMLIGHAVAELKERGKLIEKTA